MNAKIGDFVWVTREGDLEDEPYWEGIFIGKNTILLEFGGKLNDIIEVIVISDKCLRGSEREFVMNWRKENIIGLG